MAAEMKVEGMEQISEMLTKLGEQAESVAALGLYDGAGVMADAVNQAAGSIKTETFKYSVFGQRLPSPEEAAAVQKGAGVAKFEKNGSEVSTSVGFGGAGYADVAGRRKPIAQIANAINSGTSFMAKQPFVRKAANAAKERAGTAIVQAIEQKINEMTK